MAGVRMVCFSVITQSFQRGLDISAADAFKSAEQDRTYHCCTAAAPLPATAFDSGLGLNIPSLFAVQAHGAAGAGSTVSSQRGTALFQPGHTPGDSQRRAG